VTVGRFIDGDALSRSLAALRERSASTGLMDSLNDVLAASRQLFAASGCGIMMVDDTSLLCAVAATDELGRLLEVYQEEAGHGPCVDALTFDRVVHTADLGSDGRWPELPRDLPDSGVHAVLGLPLHVDRVPIGSLNVYRDQPGEWSESEIAALEGYAQLIEGFLQAALQAREREDLAVQLQHALNHRVTIERAVGVIMGRDRIGAVEAFDKLRRAARSTERKVADLAAELLADFPATGSGPAAARELPGRDR
jgi:GAF domain-containing protein